ncbi:group XIIA secretory phospholipase A2-like [Contarinia nasturtii]|uniref:group XIIA secretory phospholipase A2-like n=1 Tax=Contarinia nasturtii TaxID=265458 RepID=UPI0012D41700|nr:group XIIA secretory phospholipase A2-like [Contarinia nasturtii]XP_031637899.1 group XIIA secretory phospholipase A2-like [Contarinia nasturtii]
MQVNYMRIAIYALTFLTYAYSGYGSNIIHNLRDAIIAAEAVFGDVFKNVIHVARKFQTVHSVFDAAVEETCIFKCPGDVTPVKNRLYTPSANGCGSLGLNINKEYLPAVEMEHCCNDHDICYDTCNKDKELCDIEFKRCLYNYCDTHEKTTIGTVVSKGCKAAAKMLFTGTITLGCRSYLDAQARACYCKPKSEKEFKNKDYNKNRQKYSKDKAPPSPGWRNDL